MKLRFSYPSIAAAALLALALFFAALPTSVNAGGGFFALRGRTLNQPGQQVFITYDANRHEESFTVSPRFEGNAVDFGVVYPVPSRPKLDAISSDFFHELGVFTILKPLDYNKYALNNGPRGGFGGGGAPGGGRGGRGGAPESTVAVLETGVVGTLDYKIISAEKADDLYTWLKENDYAYSGDQTTLGYYIQKKWVFVAMKIDGKQMTQRPDGIFEGQVTPTRFTFTSDQLVYPIRMAQFSVEDKTDILFYVETASKVDLRGDFSYQCTFIPMWTGALAAERGSMVTAQEFAWNQIVGNLTYQYDSSAQALRDASHIPAVLLWAKKITAQDIAMIAGEIPFDRSATPGDVEKLNVLKGYLTEGQFLTKIRKIFTRDEMSDDLVFADAQVKGNPDTIEYFATLPTTAQGIIDYSTPTPIGRGVNRGNTRRGGPAPQSNIAPSALQPNLAPLPAPIPPPAPSPAPAR